MKIMRLILIMIMSGLLVGACTTGGDVVQIRTVSDSGSRSDSVYSSLPESERVRIAELKKNMKTEDSGLTKIIKGTAKYSLGEYLAKYPNAARISANDYKVGGQDVIDITVYEEPDLTRKGVRISVNGYISFPFIGKLEVQGLSTSEIEGLISRKLVEGNYLLDAHVAVDIVDFKNKKFIVLGSIKSPGTYPLQANERVLDAVSRAGGVDFANSGKQAMIIRYEEIEGNIERIVVNLDLSLLLKGGDQMSNLPLHDKDLLYIPKAEYFFMMGQVKNTGSYPYREMEITIVEAISMAGGFTEIAARKRTRIVRMENGVEKIIEVNVDAITKSGKKGQDVKILPGDVIIIPESYF